MHGHLPGPAGGTNLGRSGMTAQNGCLHHDRVQRNIDPAARTQMSWEERAGPDLRGS